MYTNEKNARKTGIRIAGVKPRVNRRHTDRDGGRDMATFSPTRAIALRSLILRVQSGRIPGPAGRGGIVNVAVPLETL